MIEALIILSALFIGYIAGSITVGCSMARGFSKGVSDAINEELER